MKISSPDLDSPLPLSGLPSVHYGQLPTANCASQDASATSVPSCVPPWSYTFHISEERGTKWVAALMFLPTLCCFVWIEQVWIVLPYLVCTQCYFLCVFVSDVKYVYVTGFLIHLQLVVMFGKRSKTNFCGYFNGLQGKVKQTIFLMECKQIMLLSDLIYT